MTDFPNTTAAQHVRHAKHAAAFCANVDVLLDLAANHAEERVRHAAIRAINSFALLKADPAGPDALCGPQVKKAIENAVLIVSLGSPSLVAN